MKIKIKKINNLEELKKLAPGEKIYSPEGRFEPIFGQIISAVLVYEGKVDGKYAFMEDVPDNIWETIITSWRTSAYKAFFGGNFSAERDALTFYNSDMKCYREKLNLIRSSK